jgi:hypothetical protein
VLEGELVDAGGARTPFRVAVTIESTPSADPPPVERSITSSGDWTLTVPGGLVTVRMPQSAWPTPPTPQDYILILRVDAGAAGADFANGTQIVDVSARWALAGTSVTQFAAPIEVVFSNPSGAPVIPAHSPDASAWQPIGPLGGALGAGQDGFTRSGSDVHVFTRHLTYFGLMRDDSAPTAPRDFAGLVADDGLTLRWASGTDASGQLGNFVLFVNGEAYRVFGPTEFEAKLGDFSGADTRTFTLAQLDAAGNISPQTPRLRAVPPLGGVTLERARAALGAAGFAVGKVTEVTSPTAVPGTVVAPADARLEFTTTPIDLAVARGAAAPQTRLAFSVAAAKKLKLAPKRATTIAVRINVTKPAAVTATLRDAKKRRLFSWKLSVKAGANVVKLRLPQQIRRPGTYSLTWVARSGTETVSRSVRFTLVGPEIAQVRPKRDQVEIVLAGETPAGDDLEPGRDGTPRRLLSTGGVDETFALVTVSRRARTVVVVDADRYGTRFVADLRAVFPSVRVIALSREPATRALALRAGALRVLPRDTPTARLERAIVAAAS